MYQLSHMITEQRNLLSELMTTSVSGERLGALDLEKDEEEEQGKETEEKTPSSKEFRRYYLNRTFQWTVDNQFHSFACSEFDEGRKRLYELLEKVEGCSHVTDVPTRYLLHDGDLVEMDIAENSALHRVHGYLMNDGFMVATWLPNRRGPIRYNFCLQKHDGCSMV